MNILLKVLNAYDLISHRYECFEATGQDLKACMRVREKVFGEELRRVENGKKSGPALEDEFDPVSLHIGCRDRKSGEIVGTIRSTSAVHYSKKEDYRREFCLHHFDENMMGYVGIGSRLAVLKEHRRGVVGLLLTRAAYKAGLHDYRIAAIVCEPGLYPLYRRMGYQPLDRVHPSPFGGYRLPLYLIMHDYSYLERFRSPFLKAARQLKFPNYPEGFTWQKQYKEKNGVIAPGFTPLRDSEDEEYHCIITRGLSAEAQKKLLHHAILIQCRYGDLVIRQKLGDRNIGFVKKGALEVRREDKLVTVLGEGDIFGEIAFVLNVPRTANVIAASSRTEIVLLSLSSVEKIKDPNDRETVWRNLASLLAQRLITNNA